MTAGSHHAFEGRTAPTTPDHPQTADSRGALSPGSGPSHGAVRIVINGARGRMGTRLCALARESGEFSVVAAVDEGDESPRTPFDAVIDFSSPQGTVAALGTALQARAALLVGTTGLGPEVHQALRDAAGSLAVLVAPNTSLGVAVLRHLVREAARLLKGFDVDVVESHHNRKKDAPSGTALALAAALGEGGVKIAPERVHSLRGGDIVGEHMVQFAGPGETLRLEHDAVGRDLFALGALRAAAWLARRSPGWYTMEDVVGLSAGG